MLRKEEVYKKANLGGRAGFGTRPIILVVDFQKGFTLPESTAGADMTKQVIRTAELTKAARKKNIRVVYLRLGFNKDRSDLNVFGRKAPVLKEFVRDHWYYDLDERLDVQSDDVIIEKHWPSAFFGTHLVQLLIGWKIDTVVVCGCTVGGCVYASVIDSCSYGFRTIVANDACADRSSEVFDMFMWNMDQKYADVVETEEILLKFENIDTLVYD